MDFNNSNSKKNKITRKMKKQKITKSKHGNIAIEKLGHANKKFCLQTKKERKSTHLDDDFFRWEKKIRHAMRNRRFHGLQMEKRNRSNVRKWKVERRKEKTLEIDTTSILVHSMASQLPAPSMLLRLIISWFRSRERQRRKVWCRISKEQVWLAHSKRAFCFPRSPNATNVKKQKSFSFHHQS